MNEKMLLDAERQAHEAALWFNPDTLEYEEATEGPFPGWKPEPFTIDNDSKADWAVEKIKAEEAEFNRLKLIALDRIQEINARMRELEDRCERRTGNLKALLADYFEAAGPTKITKTQSKRELISGSLVLKKQQPEFVRHEAEMIPWAKQTAPELVRVEEKISWAEMKKQITLCGEDVLYDGEVVPGVKAYARPDKFEVL